MILSDYFIEVERVFPNEPFHSEKIANGSSLEHLQVEAFFKGKLWGDINLDGFNKYIGDPSACLSFMTPEAFKYYLPAYLSISIKDYSVADVIPESTIYKIEKLTDQENQEYLDAFNLDQKKMIAMFLDYMYRQHGDDFATDFAQKALSSYWARLLMP